MNFPKVERLALVLVGSLMAAVVAAPSRAATDTWTGSGATANWNVAGNWTPGIPVNGDALLFDGSTSKNTNNNDISNLTTTGIRFGTTAAPYTLNGNAIHLGWTTEPAPGTGITHIGDIVNESANIQNVNLPITLDPAKHVISTAAARLNLAGAITQPKGSSVIFVDGGGGINLTGSGLANDASGILGGWATIGTSHAALAAGIVVPYAGYTVVNTGGVIADNANSNVRIPDQSATAVTLAAANTHVNTITYGDGVNALGAAQVIGLAGGTLTLGRNGGIFNTTGAGGNTVRALTIGSAAGDGILTAGDGTAPANINFVSTPTNIAPQGDQGISTINAVIADNNGQPVSLTIRGGYVTAAGANVNTFSGGLYILSGRYSQATTTNIGTGQVHIFPGGQVNSNNNLTNDFFIAGKGTTEQGNADGGLGALRLFGTAAFTGTITLTETAKISPTNNGLNAMTGRITGPGGLIVAGTNGAQQGGTLQLGKTAGVSLRNNYAGDTTVSGHSGGGTNPFSVLKINSNAVPSDNNFIMPHGATGSYANGSTGNLILDARLPDTDHAAVFDLNGTKQAINGLSNTATEVANNRVTSSAAGAILYVGDSNASATFAGIVTEEAGGTLGLTKIGAGTQTLTGANTYSGDTRVFGGTLSITNAYLSNSADVHVSTGAIFDLNFVGTNNIDLLYINGLPQVAGTWGSPTSAATNKSTASWEPAFLMSPPKARRCCPATSTAIRRLRPPTWRSGSSPPPTETPAATPTGTAIATRTTS